MFTIVKTDAKENIISLGSFGSREQASAVMKEDYHSESLSCYGREVPVTPDCRCGEEDAMLPDPEHPGRYYIWKIIGTRRRWYYTFGSDERYPFRNGWVIIEADSQNEAHAIFRASFPDRPGHEGTLNCAFYYTDAQWAEMDPEHNWNGYKCHGVYSRAY